MRRRGRSASAASRLFRDRTSMASAAEQMAANLSLANFAKATDLKKRLWFTLGALIVFRLLSFVPLPGIDPRALEHPVRQHPRRRARFLQHVLGRRPRADEPDRARRDALHHRLDRRAARHLDVADARRRSRRKARAAARSSTNIPATAPSSCCAIQGYFIAVGLEGWGAGRQRLGGARSGHDVPHHHRRSAWSAAPCS